MKKCNICTKEFDFWDEQEDFSICRQIGYGSGYDGLEIDLHLCCDCFDKVMDTIVPMCQIDPLSEV